MIDITVIIPSYNSGKDLIACIGSLNTQNASGFKYDILVVDSSSDSTPDMVKRAFPNLKLICSDKRLLPGAARNRGIKESGAGYLAFIDSDCLADKSWLKNLASTINGMGCDVVVGSIKSAYSFHPYAGAAYVTEFNEFMPGRPAGKSRFLLSGDMLCKKEIFDKAGVFLEDRLSGEDRILGERILEMGSRIYFDPAAVIFHKDKKSFRLLIKHQLSLGFESARARKVKRMEGGILVRFPVLTPVIPVLRFAKVFYRLLRFHEYGYLAFIVFNISTIVLIYITWTIGFINGIVHKEPL